MGIPPSLRRRRPRRRKLSPVRRRRQRRPRRRRRRPIESPRRQFPRTFIPGRQRGFGMQHHRLGLIAMWRRLLGRRLRPRLIFRMGIPASEYGESPAPLRLRWRWRRRWRCMGRPRGTVGGPRPGALRRTMHSRHGRRPSTRCTTIGTATAAPGIRQLRVPSRGRAAAAMGTLRRLRAPSWGRGAGRAAAAIGMLRRLRAPSRGRGASRAAPAMGTLRRLRAHSRGRRAARAVAAASVTHSILAARATGPGAIRTTRRRLFVAHRVLVETRWRRRRNRPGSVFRCPRGGCRRSC